MNVNLKRKEYKMPGNMIVINGVISYYVGDSKMDEVIELLDKVGLKQDINPEYLRDDGEAQAV